MDLRSGDMKTVREEPDGNDGVNDKLPEADDLDLPDGYRRAASYLSIGKIYLLDSLPLQEPLRREHIKPRLLGHWGTTLGLNFIYIHLSRALRAQDVQCHFRLPARPWRS